MRRRPLPASHVCRPFLLPESPPVFDISEVGAAGAQNALERVFKSMKESRRLERHCVRGLRQTTLHAAMSALAFQARVLFRLRAGDTEWMRWMVRKVA